MPAVTVDDITVLPRIPEPDPILTRQRPVTSVTVAPKGYEGEGFPVRRAFAGVDLADLDPFIHLDQMGEVEYAPGEPKGTPWHPHRGFETVTYMIDGTFEHADSNGGGGVITNGDTQWMTAGAGILHIEKPPEWLVASGGLFHGFQLWVNLPAAQKFSPPRYQDIRASEVALVSSPDGGALVRVIAGDLVGHAGPGSTYSPMTLIHATLSPGARLSLPWRADYNALAYVMAGHGTLALEVEEDAPDFDAIVVGVGGGGLVSGIVAALPGRPWHGRRCRCGSRRRVRPREPRLRLRGGPGPDRPAGRLRRRRRHHHRGPADRPPGVADPEPRRPHPRRTPDRRARGLDGSLRHEHAGRAHAGGRRLPGRPPGGDPGDPRRPDHDPGAIETPPTIRARTGHSSGAVGRDGPAIPDPRP